MRTRTQTALQCPASREWYPLPSEEETAGDEMVMNLLRQVQCKRRVQQHVLVYISNDTDPEVTEISCN